MPPTETAPPSRLTSRRAVLGGSIGAAGLLARFGAAHGLPVEPVSAAPARPRYLLDRQSVGVTESVVHGGAGPIRVKLFRFDQASHPSLLLLYEIPPGASEGVHTHQRGSRALGAYDEFYYILEGAGLMEIDGTAVPVSAGDHVFTPIGVPHGIRNTAASGDLKIFLTALERS